MKYLLFTNVRWTAWFVFLICIYKETQCHHLPHNNAPNSDALMGLLGVAEHAVHTAEQYVDSNSIRSEYPMDCADILKKNTSQKSGIFQIWPVSRLIQGPINVYCDMDDDGGAWTVLQRRGDFNSSQDYFYRDWESYKNGFGDPTLDFWIGNDVISALTNQRSNILKFTLSDWEGNDTYAVYDDFRMYDELKNYEIRFEGYRGTAGDGFFYANGVPFTTKDRDNDVYDPENCAVLFKGAWWYTACHLSNLNGLYLKGHHESFADGVEWIPFTGFYYSLKDTEMKIRPKDFVKMGN